MARAAKKAAMTITGRCLCQAVAIEIGVPVRWAWHDHSPASRRAHGAAYATYLGAYRSRCHVLEGAEHISTHEDGKTGAKRSFCAKCGAPLMYERAHAPTMINLPRALFEDGAGREPRYHIAIDEMAPWTYLGERLVPLKGFPGVVWDRSRKRKRDAL